MDIIRYLKPFESCKVALETHDGQYEGIISFVDTISTKIGLSYVKLLPSRESIMGLQVFFPDDIKSYSIVDDKKIEQKPLRTVNNPLQIASASAKQESYHIFAESSDEEDEASTSQEQSQVEDTDYVLVLPNRFQDELTDDYLIIDCVDKTFYNAVDHINQELDICVSFEGKKIGRHGELSLITISTPSITFIFDICALGKGAFNHGLRDVFQNPDVQKIVHDVRQPSDALYHQFQTKLTNVFDTLVAHLFIGRSHYKSNQTPEQPWNLNHCLERYLNVFREDLCLSSKGSPSLQNGELDWTVRPLNNFQMDIAIQNCIYLRHLKYQLSEKMLGEYYRAVEAFNVIVREQTQPELEEYSSEQATLLPYAGLNIRLVQLTDYFGGCKKNPAKKFLNLVKDNKIFQTPPLQSSSSNNSFSSPPVTGFPLEKIPSTRPSLKKQAGSERPAKFTPPEVGSASGGKSSLETRISPEGETLPPKGTQVSSAMPSRKEALAHGSTYRSSTESIRQKIDQPVKWNTTNTAESMRNLKYRPAS